VSKKRTTKRLTQKPGSLSPTTPSPVLDPHQPRPRKHILSPTLQVKTERVIPCHDSQTRSGTNVPLTLRTIRAPVQPARPTACSRQVKTSHAVDASENSGLALSCEWLACSLQTWQLRPWLGRPHRSRHAAHLACSGRRLFFTAFPLWW
jgi:hypothetical protein